MHRLAAHLTVLASQDEGATAVEYGLIITLIAIAIIGGATALGAAVNGQLAGVAGSV